MHLADMCEIMEDNFPEFLAGRSLTPSNGFGSPTNRSRLEPSQRLSTVAAVSPEGAKKGCQDGKKRLQALYPPC